MDSNHLPRRYQHRALPVELAAPREWQGRKDSNPRPSVLETDALTRLSYAPLARGKVYLPEADRGRAGASLTSGWWQPSSSTWASTRPTAYGRPCSGTAPSSCTRSRRLRP